MAPGTFIGWDFNNIAAATKYNAGDVIEKRTVTILKLSLVLSAGGLQPELPRGQAGDNYIKFTTAVPVRMAGDI